MFFQRSLLQKVLGINNDIPRENNGMDSYQTHYIQSEQKPVKTEAWLIPTFLGWTLLDIEKS